ncbi:MAG TPA: amidinotransferase [Flavobacteriales bacterium]|nr:amidinotransferase [Flavobacteriales bacterium]
MSKDIQVSSEVGTLKRLIIHSPDAGIGKIAPRMMEDLLYDDIVFLDKMREEYNQYLSVLLWFLDPDVMINRDKSDADFFKPTKPGYLKSDKVMDAEYLLMQVLRNDLAKQLLVSAVCAMEKCDFETQMLLMKMDAETLTRTLISGVWIYEEEEDYLFAPIPNFIFTRDIGIVINDHLLLIKAAEKGRTREALFIKYIAYFNLFGDEAKWDEYSFSNKVIELEDNEYYFLTDSLQKEQQEVSIEGGDVMMISPRHLLVGLSARTTQNAIHQLTTQLFKRNLVDKVSVVNIPAERAYMHIDTIFTMIKRDSWVVYAPFTRDAITLSKEEIDFRRMLDDEMETPEEQVYVTQFIREEKPDGFKVTVKEFDFLDDLLADVSKGDFGCEKVNIIPNGNAKFPFTEREQWTDSCNFLAIREGVIIGYDRNTYTNKTLQDRGFKIICAQDFNEQMDAGAKLDELITGDTLITLPSAELSRARGGTHCMSMPLLREEI